MPIVKNFMSTTPHQVFLHMTLNEVEEIFATHRLTTAPVLDNSERLIGVLSDYKLVKMFLRRASMKNHPNPSGLNLDFFSDELDPVISIEEQEPITNAFRLIIQSPNHRIFAMKDGKLSGVLSPKDLIPFLAGDTKERKNPNQEIKEAQDKIKELAAELHEARQAIVPYHRFFTDSPFMMHSVNMQGKILIANKMLHHVLGYNYGELVGKHITDLYPYQLHKEVFEAIERIKTIGYNPLVSSLMVKKDKHTLKVDIASMLRRDERGLPAATISIARPTEMHNMMETLREAAVIIPVQDTTNQDGIPGANPGTPDAKAKTEKK